MSLSLYIYKINIKNNILYYYTDTDFSLIFITDIGIDILRILMFFFFLYGFSITTIHESQDCRGRGRTFL